MPTNARKTNGRPNEPRVRFQVVHSLAGGTGSGLGARVVDDVVPAFPGRTVVTYTVAPYADGWPSAAQPYNATMCAARLTDGPHCAYVLDNRSLRRAATCGGARAGPAYSDLNRAAARAMAGVTAGLRFAARPNASLRKSVADLVPYAAMRFLVPGFAPLSSPPSSAQRRDVTAGGLAARLLAAVAASPDGRAVVTAAVVTYRHGPGRPADRPRGRCRPVAPPPFRWSPDTVKTASCGVPARGHRASAAVAANTTAACDAFDRVCRGAAGAAAAGPSAVLRAFADHGVTADEFRLARERVETLTDHYRWVRDRSDYDACDFDDGDDGDCDHGAATRGGEDEP